MKYVGDDYEKDMAGVAADPETQRWWKVTDGMQESFNPGATGSGQDVPWWTVSEKYNRILVTIKISNRSWTKSSDLIPRHERPPVPTNQTCNPSIIRLNNGCS
jgi:hypothetical protein